MARIAAPRAPRAAEYVSGRLEAASHAGRFRLQQSAYFSVLRWGALDGIASLPPAPVSFAGLGEAARAPLGRRARFDPEILLIGGPREIALAPR